MDIDYLLAKGKYKAGESSGFGSEQLEQLFKELKGQRNTDAHHTVESEGDGDIKGFHKKVDEVIECLSYCFPDEEDVCKL